MEKLLDRKWLVFSAEYMGHLIRYLAVAGVAYLAFYIFFRRHTIKLKIQEAFPKGSEMRREFLYSLVSIGVFASVGVLTAVLSKAGLIKMYWNVSRYGWGYLWLSTIALIFIHDTWFYWTHRLMHTRRLFPIMHKVHHLSHNPTPWAAFSFHPTEAIVQAIVFPIAAVFMPLHPFAALLWLLYMTIMNVLGHLGFEILPAGFVRHKVARWHNTSVHHNMHHRYVNCNYGLYFNIWDRLMGTNHSRYEEEYDRVTDSKQCEATSPKREAAHS